MATETSNVLERIADMKAPSPMMQQYVDIKSAYQDHILLYRLGDFFEMFFEDATQASRALELTLTSRDCGNGMRAAMCGVPFHKVDLYIGKLIEKGFKVAVCEQTEDPKAAKGIVRRDIVRVVTPGTVTDGSLLSDTENNYLAAYYRGVRGDGLAFADVSTGQVFFTVLTGGNREEDALSELGTYAPKELLINVPSTACPTICRFMQERFRTMITSKTHGTFDEKTAMDTVKETFGDAASCIGEHETDAAVAISALLSYIRETQMCHAFVRELRRYDCRQYMEIDLNTRRNLELTESMRTKEKKGSLLWVLDRTKTSMGARMLRDWLTKPLLHPAPILRRQAAVAAFLDAYLTREELQKGLDHILDLERLTAKAVYGTANAKDLRAIGQSLSAIPAIREQLSSIDCDVVRALRDKLGPLTALADLLCRALTDNPPFSLREGNIIRTGYNADVDYLRTLKENSTGWMESIEAQEREKTGIKTLHVGFNKVFGYYIEVTKLNASLVPARYIRKQTLTNCERYITQELKEMESTVLGAQDKLCNLEFELFEELRHVVIDNAAAIQQTAARIAELDVYLSLAEVAMSYHYVRPDIDGDTALSITRGRHPVVERFVLGSYFVPNDTLLNTGDNRLMLITGPNMAGKSTYMRQVALIVLMAQIGSFVPADAASVGIVDKLFTRIGASDDLASGQSTFMLEMTEVAHILKNATERSLIVYDEVGRGTSTYDGMSIARAVVEYTHSKKIGAKTMFATHYHELTVMENEFDGIVNYHIAAKKRGDTVTFLRNIVRGATDDSFGIEVAKLAGVPDAVVRRAREILSDIEANGKPTAEGARIAPATELGGLADLAITDEADEASREVADMLRKVDINTLTPIEAMNLIYTWKKTLDASPHA